MLATYRSSVLSWDHGAGSQCPTDDAKLTNLHVLLIVALIFRFLCVMCSGGRTVQKNTKFIQHPAKVKVPGNRIEYIFIVIV